MEHWRFDLLHTHFKTHEWPKAASGHEMSSEHSLRLFRGRVLSHSINQQCGGSVRNTRVRVHNQTLHPVSACSSLQLVITTVHLDFSSATVFMFYCSQSEC